MSSKKKQLIARRVCLWVALVALFFLLIWLFFALVVKLALGTSYDITLGNVKYTVSTPNEYGEYESVTKKISASTVIRNNTVYFNFTEIAESCGAKVSGDDTRIRYIFEKGEASFFFDGTLANVGDEAIILGAPSFFENGDLFVPASFADYMYSLSVEYRNRHLTVKYDPALLRPSNSRTVEPPTPVTDKGY